MSAGRTYLRPLALTAGPGRPILGGAWRAPLFERIHWQADDRLERALLTPAEAAADARVAEPLALLTDARPLGFARPRLMGILNVTPDSFSDGGRFDDAEQAVAQGRALAAAGADIVDVGGESTRPGAAEVPVAEELARVLPVVQRLAADGLTVSIDTRKAEVMAAAVAAGARLINDVSGLTHDPAALATASASRVPVVLMHMRGTPATMNTAPAYRHAALEIFDELSARIEACEAAGLARDRLVLDPGLCFAKHEPHNLDLLRHLSLFHSLGCPLLLGASRKGWTAVINERWRPAERLPSSLAACQWGLGQGVQLFRVHDVAAHRQLLEAWRALTRSADEDRA